MTPLAHSALLACPCEHRDRNSPSGVTNRCEHENEKTSFRRIRRQVAPLESIPRMRSEATNRPKLAGGNDETPDPQLRQQLDAKIKKFDDAMNKNMLLRPPRSSQRMRFS